MTLETIDLEYKETKKKALTVTLASVGVFVLAFLIGQVTGHVDFLSRVAIHPMEVGSLYSVVTYALGHVNVMHLVMNMVQMAFLAFYLTRMQGQREYIEVALVALVASGILTWFIAPEDAMIIGASGITAGLAAHLFVRSGIKMNLTIFAISGVFVAITIIGIVSAINAPENQLSWHAHVGGLLAGIITGCVLVLKDYHERKALMN